jgi:uncharacterized membrane protein YphA (DoxX/SURF4 family)
MKNKLKRAIQIIAGTIFIVSGAMKAIDSQSFSNLISAYGFGWAGNIAPIISSVEIILGLCLILDILPKTTALTTTLITIFFTLGFSYAFFFRGIEDCGCMGSFVKVSPYISFTRNIILIIGCLWIWQYFENTDVRTKNWKKWTVYILGGMSLCVSGYTLGNPLVQKDKINVGEQINNTIFQCFDNKISTDTCIVFIFRPECNHCWNTTENIKSIKRTPGFTNVVGITYSDVDTSQFMKEMKPNFEVLKYPNTDLYNYIMGVPVLLILKDGKVIKRLDADDIPCGPMLRRMFE